eukprot:TRINITY_DN957_c0_g3_i1.p1 TRINITY_DN957_c0_g3~~TRINITY_DN957_c0_g3_i1.p1  ORF type:complete len:329 (-),score=37.09 TRINITY_DN957_c0_g3_i1:612-1598(-)
MVGTTLPPGVHCSLSWQRLRMSVSERRALTYATLIASSIALTILLHFVVDPDVQENCPAPSSPPTMNPATAVALLSKARIAEMKHDLDGAQGLYWQCVQSASAGGSLPRLADIRAQLECLVDLNGESGDRISGRVNVLGARIAKNALIAARGVSRQCTLLHGRLNYFARSDVASVITSDAIVALGGVPGLESSVRDVLFSLRLLILLNSNARFGDSLAQAAEVASARHDLLMCALMSARQARLLAHSLSPANLAVRKVNLCKPNLLAGFESVSLAESDGVVEAAVTSQRESLLSEITSAPPNAPFVGPQDDAGGWSADWLSFSKNTEL